MGPPTNVRLDALTKAKAGGVPLETVIETAWAITHYVYTNDNDDPFILRVLVDSQSAWGSFVSQERAYDEFLGGIAETLQLVSETIAQNWTLALNQMNFLGPQNWHRLIRDAPETAVIGRSVMRDILDHWSTNLPNKIAVEAWDGDLTYSELHESATRLGQVLIQAGVGFEERVGICMKKSKWSIIAFWGLLLAGITGVPLDVRNPKKRTSALLARVEARFVIADEWTAPNLEGIDAGIIHCDEDTLKRCNGFEAVADRPPITPRTVAFILFTSGSTGFPKAVTVEHGPLYGSTVEIARELYLEESSKSFQFASFVSDISMGDIFATMFKGGCIYVPSEEDRLSNLEFVLEKCQATHAALTSTVMSQLNPVKLTRLRYMIAVGEAISKENTVRWRPPSVLPLDKETRALFTDLQSKLVEFLPQYMIPSLFIPVEDIPKNAAGKRDRITLLQWGAALTEEQISEYQLRTISAETALGTSTEKLLRKVWARVLKAPESSFASQDNFFQAGGDSIKVIELLAVLREQGKTITVAEVFQHPIMQEMAEHLLDTAEADKSGATQPFELFPGGREAATDVIQEVADACKVNKDAIEDIYPPTPLQEALMAISGQRSESYTHRMVFTVPDTLDIRRFQQACETLVAEQAIFRTAILTLPNVGTVQVVLRSKIKWHEFECLDDLVHFDSATPFSYGTALCRYALVREKQNVTHFVWSGHHSISDGWSRPAMFNELRHIYEQGTAHPQVPFTLFIKHVSQLDSGELDRFWIEQFPDSVEHFPKLPTSGYTPKVESSANIDFILPRQEKSQITTATVLQAAWALVLGTYSNLDEAVFGLTLSGRDAPVPGITETMGVTITTVPVRIVFDNTSTIVEYLHEVQQYVSTIKNHQHIGLQRIQRLSPEARSATRFDNLLVVQPVDESEDHKALEGLGLKLVQREERDAGQYALTVKCTIGNMDGSVYVNAYYDENIVDQKLMECLLHQFQHLVTQLAAESDETSLHDLDKMSPHDLDLLAQWNGQVPAAIERTLHDQFQEKAAATPNAIALDGFDGKLTYEELDSQSTQLGRYLHHQADVSLESRVILCLEKSKIPIISMLAVLKSGGVCVSINPEHPTPRLVDIIHDAGANVVLCDEHSVDRFKDHATHVLGISESVIAQLMDRNEECKLPQVAPSNGSFVVFTSGSTGKPKGSLLEHRSLATDMAAVGERVGLDATSRTLQFSSYTFDAHILEIFGTLLKGGCVCVISDSERMNNLSEVMNERQVNFALLTKTVSRLLDPKELPALKCLILSGEANGRQDYWRWAERVRDAQASLIETLPSYMVPSLFIPVTHLPLNASGKLERNTLRSWVSDLSADRLGQYYLFDRTSSREPETRSEKHLQSLWAKVLEIPLNTIHAEDNFFRLGGDSVLSMRLIADARAEGLSMTVAEIFRTPILQDLAESVSDRYHIHDSGLDSKVPYEPFSLLKDKESVDACIKQAAEDCDVPLDMIEDIYPSTPTQEALMAVSSHRPKAYTYQIILKIPNSMPVDSFIDSADVVFGLMLSGRDAPVEGIEDVIGPTIATVPLRAHIDRTRSISEILEEMQRKGAEIRKYQHAGLQRIRRLSPEASAAVEFQNLLVVHTMGDAEITSPLGELGLQPERNEMEEFLDLALTAECTIRPGTLKLLINYDGKVVADEQADFMLHQLEHVVTLLIREPLSLRLGAINLSSPHDFQALSAWNNNIGNCMESTLHELVEAQTHATPNAIATSGYDGEYTFLEVDHVANHLASKLVSLGIGPEKHVVLCFRKATLPIIAILAVLKSGGVCVSLNIDHPLSRRLDLCRDVAADAVVCDPDQEKFFSGHVAHVVALNSDFVSTSLKQKSPEYVKPKILPSNAAFIIYTSGSTGKPKGCVLEHRSISFSLKTYATTFNVTKETRFLQFAAYSFDAHILEIFGTLIHGGCVCVISETERMNNLTQAINDRKATRVLFTPTVAQLVNPDDVPTIDTIALGAEPLTKRSIEICTTPMIAFVKLLDFGTREPQSLEVTSEKNIVSFRNLIHSIEGRLPEKLPQYMIPSAFVPVAFIPISASTKIERKRLREYAQNPTIEAYLSSENNVAKESPSSSTEATLHLIWSQVLNLKPEEIGINENFTSLGGDSITAMQVVSECRKHSIKVQVATILEKKTIKAIAPYCIAQIQSARTNVRGAADGQRFHLSSIQSFYFEHEDQTWKRFNQSFLCRVKRGISAIDFKRAVELITSRHAMLRARFSQTKEGWMQYTVEASSNEAHNFTSHEIIEAVSDDVVDTTVNARIKTCCKESLAAIDIIKGPVFSVDFFNNENGDSIVYMAAHHLVVDLVSWRIIWRDIEDILQSNTTDLPQAMHFSSWVTLQQQEIKSEEARSAATKYLSSLPVSQYGFWSVPREDNILEHSVETSFALSLEESSLILGKANNSMQTVPMDIAIGVFLKSFQESFPERGVPTILVESHGREAPNVGEDDDVSRTVGWFTSLCPLHVPVVASSSTKDAIRLAKDARRSVPKSGQSFFNFSSLTPQGKAFKNYEEAEVLVNYSGIFQQLETNQSILQLESRASINNIEETDLKSRRFAMINLEVGVSCGIMQFSFTTHKKMAHQERFHSCVQMFRVLLSESLQQLDLAPPMFTLTDFPRLRLSFTELEDLVPKSLPQGDLELCVRSIEDIYPCTAMQEGILLSQQTNSQAYQLKHVWEFKHNSIFGSHLVTKIESAWKVLVSRHSSLRTAIVEYASHNGHFVQLILKELPPSRLVLSERVIDDLQTISSIVGSERDAFWEHLPQLTIYHTKDGNIACGLKLSHALMDGTSLDLLMEQLIHLMMGHTEPSIIHDFGKYVDWEQGLKSDDDVGYWANYLKGAQPCHIPVGKSHDSDLEYGYIKLPQDTAEGLGRFSRDHDITQAVVIQAAWAMVLGAFTGQEEVCFGYLASGRDAPLDGIEQSIGLYISMQVCRVHLEGMAGTLLRGINDSVITGLKHRNCSLARIQSMMGLNGLPLFNTCLTIRRFLGDATASTLGDLVTVLEGAEKTEFAIALDATVAHEGADVGMSYQKSIVSPAFASSIAGSLEAVIRSLLRAEDAPIQFIDLIGKNDDQLVKTWNQKPDKVNQTLHGLVEQQVLATPDRIATSGFDGEYTYFDLNRAAEKLAYHLVSHGVGTEKRVVLCFAKSTWPVVAMLSILKAGGVCVSTNPDHPDARLLDIVNDVEATVVVCDAVNAARFQAHVLHVITVNEHTLSQLQVPSTWKQPVVKPEDAAFVVYTSGSTGKPKGCILEHHSVSKSQIVNAEAMRIRPASRVMQFAAYTFDASICEIFAPLIVGACLCIASDDERMDDLAGVINMRKANWIMLTPTVAQLFSPAAVPTLETLVFGGEPLSQKAIEIWHGHVHLVNYWAFIKLEVFSVQGADSPTLDVNDTNLQQEFRGTVGQLKQALASVLPQYMVPSAFIPVSRIPITPSAKTDKKMLRDFAQSLTIEAAFMQDTTLTKQQPTNKTEYDLQQIWVKVLNLPVERIGIHDSFMSIGGDSITAMRVVALCRKAQLKLPVSAILQKKTIAAIAPHCQRDVDGLPNMALNHPSPGTLFDLTPIQRRYFEQESESGRIPYNQSLMLRLKTDVPTEKLKAAFDLIVSRHGMLRARFLLVNGRWQQRISAENEDSYRLTSHNFEDFDEQSIVRIAQRSSSTVDIVHGPVFSVDVFKIAGQDGVVFLAAHHLVIDIVSWQIILGEFEEIIKGGTELSQPSLTFQQWAQVMESEIMHSTEEVLPIEIPPSNYGFWQVPIEENVFKHALEVEFRLPTTKMDLILDQSNRAMSTTPLEILLGPLLLSFRQLFPERDIPSVFIEHHGREILANGTVEASQVVGWFTTMHPVRIPLESDMTIAESIRHVKDLRRKVPGNGLPYLVFRHLTAEGADKYSQHDPVELLINYSGAFQQLETQESPLAMETRVKEQISDADPRAHRWAMIDVEISISDNSLHVSFFVNEKMAHLDRIRQWVDNYKNLLMEAANELPNMPPIVTLSDFPLLNVSHEVLDAIVQDRLPGLGYQAQDIQDMLPTSSFQRFALRGHLHDPPRHWTHYYFELPLDVDVGKLQNTCLDLVKHYSILRTIFIQHEDAFVQVVLKSYKPEIDYHYNETQDITMFTESIFHRDLTALPSMGKPFLRFTVIQTLAGCRLLMRLSHAQFDGFSRVSFVRTLANLYHDRNIPCNSLDYSEFIQQTNRSHARSCEFWRELLLGSHPTKVLNIDGNPNAEDRVIRVEKNIPPFRRLEGITSATFFNAACAILVQTLTNSSDVIFSRFTSGRAALDASFQELIGPCTGLIPLRVRFPQGYETDPSHVFEQIHEQSIKSISYETVGLDDIIRECTDWSTSMESFPIITQHLNLEEGSESELDSAFSANVWEPTTADPFPWSLALGAFPGHAGVRISAAVNSSYNT
ncbi:unnamed protein product [Clonostachys rosea]|uniref:Carrier domain-containing protein n=1 Tax=Bionectria ochroleuca TaxID=29856 RepID=A0ABY6TZ25_BIOOC|nr:unnamed protein product [Clonostachys rosea]